VTAVDIYFSDYFRVEPRLLADYGAFDISLVNDLPLFVDPFLLFNSDNTTYQHLHEQVITYMRFLKGISANAPLTDALVRQYFAFPEIKQNWLGYSKHGNAGHGLGEDFARALRVNFTTVFSDFGSETVTIGSHIEKLALIRSGVGRDNISDFTTNLILHFLATYTQRFALDHIDPALLSTFALRRAGFDYTTQSWRTRTYTLPRNDVDFVLLTPKDILTRDETWISRRDLYSRFIGIADALANAELRDQVNAYLIQVLPAEADVSEEAVEAAINAVISRFPAILDYYIRDRENDGDRALSVADRRVREVQQQFVDNMRMLVATGLEPAGFYRVAGNTYAEAMERLMFLKDVVEKKGGHRLFYVDGIPVRRESDLQVMFRLTWFATPSDISREVNDGRGPADFKVSRGAPDKTIVEFKLASNSKLERNLERQTGVYEAASDATHPSIKAIFYFTEAELARVGSILERLKLTASPHIVLVDARSDNKPSGSAA
jgi:hypothetical protein